MWPAIKLTLDVIKRFLSFFVASIFNVHIEITKKKNLYARKRPEEAQKKKRCNEYINLILD